MLYLESGGITVTITDNGVLDSNPQLGVITYIGAVGNFSINVTTAMTKPLLGDASSRTWTSTRSIPVPWAASSSSGFPTTILTTLPPTGFSGAVGGTVAVGGTASFKLYVNPSNNPLDISQPALFSHGPFGSGAFDNTRVGSKVLAAPYSMTIEAIIDHSLSGSGVASSFDYDVKAFSASSAVLGDLVFNDLNANGVQDGGGEVGSPG